MPKELGFNVELPLSFEDAGERMARVAQSLAKR